MNRYIVPCYLFVLFVIMGCTQDNNVEKEKFKTDYESLIIHKYEIEKTNKISLVEIAPFEWEKVFFFGPYTLEEDMEKALGFTWKDAPQLWSEGLNVIVFVKDGQVVNYIENIYYLSGNRRIVVINREDAEFEIVKSPGSETLYLDLRGKAYE